MLNALQRTASISALLLVAACQFGSAPTIGQSSGTWKKSDAGADSRGRRVTVATGDVEADAAADAEPAADSRASAGGAAVKGGAGSKSTTKNNGGAGGQKADDQQADDQDQDEADDDKKPADDQNQDPNPPADPPADSGAAMSLPDASAQPTDAGADAARPMVENPTGVLEDLANRSAGDKTAMTIDRFLETLSKGDVPAESIQEFLLAVDSEMDCKKNGFATECLAACQAVSTTCYLCVLNEPCRTTMLDICGFAALAGCVPRR